jgi:hypothetical protein
LAATIWACLTDRLEVYGLYRPDLVLVAVASVSSLPVVVRQKSGRHEQIRH